MPNMKKEYLLRAGYDLDKDSLMRSIPTSVNTLVTQCSAVKDHYFSRFKLEAKRATAPRDNLKGVIRRIIAEREIADRGSSLEQEVMNNLDVSINKKVVLELIDKLSDAMAAGWALRIGSKESLMGMFTTYIVASYDLCLTKDDDLKVFRLSKSAQINPSIDARLIYLLLPFQKAHIAKCEYIHYPLIGVKSGKKLEWDGKKIPAELRCSLKREDLIEPPGDTIKKIICKLSDLKRQRGSECEKCPHSPYCPVLRDLVKEAVDAKNS